MNVTVNLGLQMPDGMRGAILGVFVSGMGLLDNVHRSGVWECADRYGNGSACQRYGSA